ncbi:MAG: hypothetical protein ABFS38_12445 [Bacteroidota bacterium]
MKSHNPVTSRFREMGYPCCVSQNLARKFLANGSCPTALDKQIIANMFFNERIHLEKLNIWK